MRQRVLPAFCADQYIPANEYSVMHGAESNQDLLYEVKNDAYAIYRKINFGQDRRSFRFRILVATCRDRGVAEVRLGNPQGALLASIPVTKTGADWWDFVWFESDISDSSELLGMQDICIVFRTENDSFGNVKAFEFVVR